MTLNFMRLTRAYMIPQVDRQFGQPASHMYDMVMY
jgi:hypothetical protein